MAEGVLRRFVLGFAFTPGMCEVALIRKLKVRPGFEFMSGRLNGLGGKIQEGELPLDAMAREFKEESGVEIPADSWKFCGSFLRRGDYEVLVYRAVDDAARWVTTAAPWEGEVSLYLSEDVAAPERYPGLRPVATLSWLLPLLRYRDLRIFRVIEK